MPKLLPDAAQRILETAVSHFKRFGFEKTDMKRIAEELNLSVGTVYNHFHSKSALFLAVFQWWHDDMAEAIGQQLAAPSPAFERLVAVLDVMLTNASNFMGLWKELMLSGEWRALKQLQDGELQRHFKAEEERFQIRLAALLTEVCQNLPSADAVLAAPEGRFAKSLISTCFALAMTFPDQAEANRRYLRDWCAFVFQKECKE